MCQSYQIVYQDVSTQRLTNRSQSISILQANFWTQNMQSRYGLQLLTLNVHRKQCIWTWNIRKQNARRNQITHLSWIDLPSCNILNSRINVKKPSWIYKRPSVPFQVAVISFPFKKPTHLINNQTISYQHSSKLRINVKLFLSSS